MAVELEAGAVGRCREGAGAGPRGIRRSRGPGGLPARRALGGFAVRLGPKVFRARLASLALLATLACADPAGPPAGFPEPPTGDVRLPASVLEAYRQDAARLAVRHLEAVSAGPLGEVRIPESLVDGFDALLLAVAGLDHPARDSVVERYAIHTFPQPALHELLVGVEPSAEWAGAWRRGERLTGNERVDGLIEEFDLELLRYFDYPSVTDAALLRSEAPLAIAALARRFAGIGGVAYAEPNSIVGDGNDIRATGAGDAWVLEYSVGFGDCPAGCIARHVWRFRVKGDGEVEFVGSSGPPPPAPRAAGSGGP